MTYCERLSEQLAIVAVLDPHPIVGNAATTNVFAMTLHRRALFILQTGVAFAAGTVHIQEDNVVGFTGTVQTVLTGAVGTVTAADSQYLYEVSAEAMSHGYQWLRCSIVGLTNGEYISMVVLADVDRYKPAVQYDLASVAVIQSTA